MTLTYSEVAVVIPTRGDVEMWPTLDPFQRCPFGAVVTADNSKGEDLAVYARYWAIDHTDAPVILTVDDDVILPRESIDALLAAYRPGHVTANMPAAFRHVFYEEHCLVGFGAVFDRDLPRLAFDRFWRFLGTDDEEEAPSAALVRRRCDIAFTALTPRVLVDVPYQDREFASAPGRMWTSPGHLEERTRMLRLARKVRDAVPC